MKWKKALLISSSVILALCLLVAGIYFFGGWKITVTPRGNQNMQIGYGENYTDAGADAVLTGMHLVKVSIPVQVEGDTIKTDTLETHTVRYSADVLGFHGKAERTVQVVDDTPPEITLTTDPDAYTLPGHAYEEEGYTATDNYDGNLTDKVTSVEKNGVVYYSVTDSSGNTATAERTIVYDDRTAPVITLEGDNPLTVEKGTDRKSVV